MKSKRRHELKSNDLAHSLEQLSHSFKDWGVYVIGAIAVVIVGTLIVTYMKTARATAMNDAYAELEKLGSRGVADVGKSNEEWLRSLSKMGDLANSSTDPVFKLDALLLKAETAMRVALESESGVDVALLKEAREAFEAIVSKHKDMPIHYGRALFGLYQVEANEFSADGDPSHRDQAEGYLEKLRDEPRLAGVPFQTMAIDKLNELDQIFTKVTFPERPAAVTQMVIPQGGSNPSATVKLGSPTPVEVPTEDDAPAAETSDDETSDDETTDDGSSDEAVDEVPEVEDTGADAADTPDADADAEAPTPSSDDGDEPAEAEKDE